jgi:hypothetical protein
MRKYSESDRKAITVELGFKEKHADTFHRKWKTIKGHAAQRNIEFCLSYKQYVKLAAKAGLTNPGQIGPANGQYVVGRVGDSGPYKVGNCRFIPREQNQEEAYESIREAASRRVGITKAVNPNLRNGREGHTKETHTTLRHFSKIRTGLTKETTAWLAESSRKQHGRTKDTHKYLQDKSEAYARKFKAVSPDGTIYKSSNLTEFCKKHGLHKGAMAAVCRGTYASSSGLYKGWYAKYLD